jgi:hypothetical protein
MPADTSMPISQTIPGTVTIAASGASHIHAFTLQGDGDCSVQFFKADGTTALTGLIHVPCYQIFSQAMQSVGLIRSDAGIKLTVVGNPSGKLSGFVTYNA